MGTLRPFSIDDTPGWLVRARTASRPGGFPGADAMRESELMHSFEHQPPIMSK